MLTAFLIIAFSVVMLSYWFRYSYILILRNQLESKRTSPSSSRFDSAAIQQRLRNTAELDPLHRELARDYRVLTYLLEHAPGLELASFEHHLLIWDCRMMQLVYRLTRTAAPNQARKALAEMAEIVNLLGRHLQDQVGPASESI
jgi:hypothetical protein